MKRRGSIEAIEHVRMQAARDTRAQIRWFYEEVVGLTPVASDSNEDTLQWKSSLTCLHVDFVDEPDVDPMFRRATVRVQSLERVAETLNEHKIAHEFVSGLNWTDQRLCVLDPAGNRVEFRREWPPL